MQNKAITTAPQFGSELFQVWQHFSGSHSFGSFCIFMTTPSAERDTFVAQCSTEIVHTKGITGITIKSKNV